MDISKALNLRENAKSSYGKDYTTADNITNFLKVLL